MFSGEMRTGLMLWGPGAVATLIVALIFGLSFFWSRGRIECTVQTVLKPGSAGFYCYSTQFKGDVYVEIVRGEHPEPGTLVSCRKAGAILCFSKV